MFHVISGTSVQPFSSKRTRLSAGKIRPNGIHTDVASNAEWPTAQHSGPRARKQRAALI